MRVTYLDHSGFCVELAHHILVFDWVKGDLPAHLDPDLPMVVFASHFHGDHFTFELFRRLAGRPQVRYVLGRDIKKQWSRGYFAAHGVDGALYDSLHFMGADEELQLAEPDGARLEVSTLRSTDSGVAFLVTDGSARLYHAGDLNWWVWAGETPAYNRQMTADFLAQMAKLEGQRFDAAFLPLDPRQEADYARGFDCFMRRTRTAQGWPMHFWGDESVFDRLTADPCSEPYRERIAPVSLYHRTAL